MGVLSLPPRCKIPQRQLLGAFLLLLLISDVLPDDGLIEADGTHTVSPSPEWYRQYHRTWLWLCHSRIVVSPSCGLGGSTPGETTSLFTNQRRNGRAFSSLTARGGGLPIGVNISFIRKFLNILFYRSPYLSQILE